MHESVYLFGERVVSEYNLSAEGKLVIELGSQNVNGSLRDFFHDVTYIGYDIQEADGVDVVIENIADLLDVHHEEGSIDVIVCTEMLEHDPYFWKTLDVIKRLLKPGGFLVLSARGVNTETNIAMWEHSHPHDYWRFMPQSVPLLFEFAECELLENHKDLMVPGFYGIGKRKEL